MLSEEQIALYARQILVIGGKGQEKLCAARAKVSPDSLTGRYLAASGVTLADDGEPLCADCERELHDGAALALAFQQRVLNGRCPRHPEKP
jgi:hypothetical protein